MCLPPTANTIPRSMKMIAQDHEIPHKQCEYGLNPVSVRRNGETINFNEKMELWTTDRHCDCHSKLEFKERVNARIAEITSYPVQKGWRRVNSSDGKCFAIVRVWREDHPVTMA